METIQNTEKIIRKNGKVLVGSVLGVCLAVFLDQFTKYLAAAMLKGKPSFVLIPGVFEFKYLENESAAFSLDPVSILHKILHISYFDANPNAFLWCKMIFFVAATLVVVVLLTFFYRRIPWERHYLLLNLVVLGLIAGAIGNLIDRILHQYVIDFFYFSLINFPIFNVADIYVTLSMFAFIAAIFFVYKETDFELLFPDKKKEEGRR